MMKLVSESIEPFLFEDNENKPNEGPIRSALKYIKSAPGRSLRKKRARYVMLKYKKKLIGDIDRIFSKYVPVMENIVDRVENRILAVNNNVKYTDHKAGTVSRKAGSSSVKSKLNLVPKGDPEVASLRYEDILTEVRNSIEDIIRKIKETCNKAIDHYAKSIIDRLDRTGTLTGVEFYPEEKTTLMNEWRAIEEDTDVYIENKLVGLIDDISVSEMEDIKAQLRVYIDNQEVHQSPTVASFKGKGARGMNLVPATSSYTVIADSKKKNAKENYDVLRQLQLKGSKNKITPVKPEMPFRLKASAKNIDFFDDNATNINRGDSDFFKFVVNDSDEALAIQFYDISRTKETPTSAAITIPIKVKTSPKSSIASKVLSGTDIIDILFDKCIQI